MLVPVAPPAVGVAPDVGAGAGVEVVAGVAVDVDVAVTVTVTVTVAVGVGVDDAALQAVAIRARAASTMRVRTAKFLMSGGTISVVELFPFQLSAPARNGCVTGPRTPADPCGRRR